MTSIPVAALKREQWPRFATSVHGVFLTILVTVGTVALLLQIVDEPRYRDTTVIIGFVINIAISILALAWATAYDAISLRIIFWYFNLLFFGIAPLATYLTGYWTFPVAQSTVVEANLYVLASYVIYLGSYELGLLGRRHPAQLDPALNKRVLSTWRLTLLGLMAALLVGALVAAVGFSATGSMVLRAFGGQYTPGYLLAEFAVRPMVFFIFLFAFFNFRNSRRTWLSRFALVLTFVTAMAMLGPFSSGRFLIFAFYFGLLVLLYPPTMTRRYVYLGLLFFGLFGSFLQEMWRRLLGGNKNVTAFSGHYFYQGHFDAFENFCHSIAFVAAEGIVWGKQFLGALLFWIPRSVWPDKPIGSAAFVASNFLANTFDVGDTNIASPLIQEAYLNFHIVGIALVFGLLGFVSARADSGFAHYLARVRPLRDHAAAAPGDHTLLMVFYPVSLGLSMFILRGDFLSGFAYGSGIIFSFLLVRKIVSRRAA